MRESARTQRVLDVHTNKLKGYSNAAIAMRLGISEGAVRKCLAKKIVCRCGHGLKTHIPALAHMMTPEALIQPCVECDCKDYVGSRVVDA
jgi:hypothetical protein